MTRTELPSTELIESLAAAAHAIWCDSMKREGWRLGEQYDPAAKTDPCLRPFDDLPAFERDHLLDGNVWYEAIRTVCDSVDSALRFASGELRSTDVRIGSRVRLTPGKPTQEEVEVWEGQVVELKPSASNSGRLMSIGVRWQDGSTEQYQPHELEVVGAVD
jgi:hypothetical protein